MRMHAKVLYLGPRKPMFRAVSSFLMHRISLDFIPQFNFGGGNHRDLKPGLGASRSAADVALEERLRGLMRTGKIERFKLAETKTVLTRGIRR